MNANARGDIRISSFPSRAATRSDAATFGFYAFCGAVAIALGFTTVELLLFAGDGFAETPRFRAVLVYALLLALMLVSSFVVARSGGTAERLASVRTSLLFVFSSISLATGTYTLGWNTHAATASIFSSTLICIAYSTRLANLSLIWFFTVGLLGFALSPDRAPLTSSQAYPLAASWSIFSALVLPFSIAAIINVIVGRVLQFYAHAQASMAESAQELQRIADTDPLTGFFSRHRLQREFEAMISQVKSDKPLIVALLDLDNFKAVNTSAGHAAGDEVLQDIAKQIRTALPDASLIRLGGDEFLALSHRPAGDKDQASRLDQLAKSVPTHYLGDQIWHSMSIGYTVISDAGVAISQAIAEADLAMRQAKREGKARVVCYQPGASVPAAVASSDVTAAFNPSLKGSDIKQEIPARSVGAAIMSEEIDYEFQPIVDTNAGVIVGVEGLLRWRLPDDSLVPLEHYLSTFVALEWQPPFIDFLSAKRISLLSEIREISAIDVHFNYAVESIQRHSNSEEVAKLVDTARDSSRGLVIELSEKRFQHVSVDALPAKNAFPYQKDAADMGVKLALDDFGTGVNNLDTLINYPVQIVKLDRSVCVKVDKSRRARAVIEHTQQICKELGITLIAEGLETADQCSAMRDLGVAIHQGFYHFKSMRLAELKALLAQQVKQQVG